VTQAVLKLETKPRPGGESSGFPPLYAVGSGLYDQAVLGIDLGSKFLRMAWFADNELHIHSVLNHGVPSAVAVTPQGKLRVGPSPQELSQMPVITSPRNFIGTNWQVPTDFGSFNAATVYATRLYWSKLQAEHCIRQPVCKAVFTVPVDYTAAQRALVQEIASVEGLQVLQLINEPTAMALDFFKDNVAPNGNYLFISAGHSSFGAVSIRYSDGIIEVQATSGERLGLENFDQLLVDMLVSQAESESKLRLRWNNRTIQKFAQAAEEARTILNYQEQAFISVKELSLECPGVLHMLGNNQFNLSTAISREQYYELTRPLLERAEKHIKVVLKEANFDVNDSNFKGTVLGGGMRHMQGFINMVRANTGIYGLANCAEGAAACGATKLAELILHNDRSLVVWDGLTLPISIVCEDGKIQPVLAANTPLPVKAYKRIRCRGGTATVDVYQGRGNKLEDLALQGTLIINNIPSFKEDPFSDIISEGPLDALLSQEDLMQKRIERRSQATFDEEVELEIGFLLDQGGLIKYSARHVGLDVNLAVHFSLAENNIDKSCIDEVEEWRRLSEQLTSRRLDRLARKLNIDRERVFEALRQMGYTNKSIADGSAIEAMLHRLRRERRKG
jgi:molecular chaperone DnaK (HSP70)